MGALPKNKISRVEQGKRRRGNRPMLKRDTNVASVPMAKKGLVDQIFSALGITAKTETSK